MDTAKSDTFRSMLKNTCILIRPPQGNADPIQSSRMLTMTPDMFFAACQCFGMVSGETVEQCKTAEKKKTAHETRTNVIDELQSGHTEIEHEKKKTESNEKTPSTQKDACDRNSATGECETSPTLQGHVDSSASLRKARNRSSSPLAKKSVEHLLKTLQPRYGDVALEEFSSGLKRTDLTKLSPMKYLQTHVTLLQKFVHAAGAPTDGLAEAMTRYLCHLKELLVQFEEQESPPVEIIKFDAEVLQKVRKYGGWEFKRAKKEVRTARETEKQQLLRHRRRLSADEMKHDAQDVTRKTETPAMPLAGDRTSVANRTAPVLTSQQKPRKPDNHAKSADNERGTHAHPSRSHDASTLDPDRRGLKRQQYSPSQQAREEPRGGAKRSRYESRSPASGPRMGYRRGGSDESRIVANKFNTRNEVVVSRVRHCRFFNSPSGHCNKGQSCDFRHECMICGSASHGKFKCPSDSMNHRYNDFH